MGELLLCSQEIASVPYYIETISLNVYSLEELCYYLKHNIDLVEPELMDEELCRWIRTELKMEELAERLLTRMREGGSLSEFISSIVKECSYCTAEEVSYMQEALAAFENKSELECRKIRADRFLEKKKYKISILEYQKLLNHPEVKERGGLLEGNIWHNLGTAYAGLFLFEDAAFCYQKAYEKNQNPVSMKQHKEAVELAKEPFALLETADTGEDFTDTDSLLTQWREEYYRSCR